MDVRALVAVQTTPQGPNQVQPNINKIPNHPLICSIACLCFESFQKGITTTSDQRTGPTSPIAMSKQQNQN